MIIDMKDELKKISREFLLSFWKIHILYHADRGPVVGQWMLYELRSHGYDISPGTLYPLLKRMEKNGWLRSEIDILKGPRARRDYYLTDKGKEVLSFLRKQVKELWEEISEGG